VDRNVNVFQPSDIRKDSDGLKPTKNNSHPLFFLIGGRSTPSMHPARLFELTGMVPAV
jgi:hypothetical protein